MRNTVFTLFCAFAVAGVAPAAVTITGVKQGEDRNVTITYAADREQIVTFGVETNAGNGVWARLPGESLRHLSGDCAMLRPAGQGVIRWSPDFASFDADFAAGQIRFVVNAYERDNPPDYLVVDLAEKTSDAHPRLRFYERAEDLPGGLLGNEDYRMRLLVLRRIHARGVPWVMGSSAFENGRAADETPHQVTLGADYWIGVFPLTHAQSEIIYGKRFTDSALNFPIRKELRLKDRVFYSQYEPIARGTAYPEEPAANSVPGLLRTRCRNADGVAMLAFDLPTEAEWEFACRAGTASGYWNDGSPIDSTWSKVCATSATLPGRYLAGADAATLWAGKATLDPDVHGPPIAGSYPPNAFGLYDMHGGVWEYCLDTYAADITAQNGAVQTGGAEYVKRGGSWCACADLCRSACRATAPAVYSGDYQENGLRIAAPIDIAF